MKYGCNPIDLFINHRIFMITSAEKFISGNDTVLMIFTKNNTIQIHEKIVSQK